jgi:hypothetical protein
MRPNVRRYAAGVKYAICIYWAMGEITGSGDLPGPTNTSERLYLLFIQIFCVFLNAMIIGGVVSIIEAFNARKKEFHNSMDNLNTFLREKNLKATDLGLCTRLRQYYLFKQYHGANDADIWEDVLMKVSPTLQGEVATGMHGSWMSTVPYFQGVDRKTGIPWTISERFKVAVALSITSAVYAPFEPIYNEFDVSEGLMVIERGLAGALGRLMRKGTSFGQDVFLNEEGTALRGHNANALTHTMVLCVPGPTLHELLALPENEHVRKQVRMRICRETMKDITLRIQKYLTLASNIEISPFDAVALMEKEFGAGVFSKVPMMREQWNERRIANGDLYIKHVMVLQRAISAYKFRQGVAKAIKNGKVVRLMREAKHGLKTMINAVGLDPDDYVEKLVASHVTADMLPEMTAAEITVTGILLGDAIKLVKAVKGR